MTRGDKTVARTVAARTRLRADDGPNVTDSGVRSTLAAAAEAAGGETMGSSPCSGLFGGPFRTTADGAE